MAHTGAILGSCILAVKLHSRVCFAVSEPLAFSKGLGEGEVELLAHLGQDEEPIPGTVKPGHSSHILNTVSIVKLIGCKG